MVVFKVGGISFIREEGGGRGEGRRRRGKRRRRDGRGGSR
jgi:hypothetical protein